MRNRRWLLLLGLVAIFVTFAPATASAQGCQNQYCVRDTEPPNCWGCYTSTTMQTACSPSAEPCPQSCVMTNCSSNGGPGPDPGGGNPCSDFWYALTHVECSGGGGGYGGLQGYVSSPSHCRLAIAALPKNKLFSL